jgi:uncharacterized protein (DUF2164 family)
MDEATRIITNQISDALSEHHQWSVLYNPKSSTKGDLHRQMKVYTKLSDVIIRFAPQGSVYRKHSEVIFQDMETQLTHPYSLPESHLARLAAIVDELKDAYEKGYLTTINELINSELFSDFLEMGNYYLNEGHKDAAAVILGGVLEEHVRKLCQKNGIALTYQNDKGETKPKKTSSLNQDLVKKAVYNEGQKKQIDAWLSIRNSAAHGKYSEYTKEQVQNMLDGMRNFFLLFVA